MQPFDDLLTCSVKQHLPKQKTCKLIYIIILLQQELTIHFRCEPNTVKKSAQDSPTLMNTTTVWALADMLPKSQRMTSCFILLDNKEQFKIKKMLSSCPLHICRLLVYSYVKNKHL